MAVLSLDLVTHSAQDTITTTQRQPVRIGYGYYNNKTNSKRFNMTVFNTLPTTTIPQSTTVNQTTTTPTPPTARVSRMALAKNATRAPKYKKPKKTLVIKRRKTPKDKDHEPAHANKHTTKWKKDLTAKSNMHVLQFYAQPLNTFDLNVQPLNNYNTYDPFSNANQLTVPQPEVYMAPQNYITPLPTVSPLAYKTIPEDYQNSAEFIPKPVAFKPVNYNWNPATDRPIKPIPMLQPISYSNVNWSPVSDHPLKPIPMLDPFNLYKRTPKYRPKPIQPQKFIATVKPVTSVAPPITVTHVYKYTEGTGIKLPFVSNDDSFDENLPILTAALDGHLNDRVESTGVKNYMTPPKMNQPLYYSLPTVTLPPQGSGYQNEFQLINKFNDDLRAQTYYSPRQPSYVDKDENETQEEKNYSDEDVKKALEYIQHLKRTKSKSSRGEKKFNAGEEERPRSRKRKEKNREEDEDTQDDELELDETKKKRKRKNKEFTIDDDDDFQVKPFSDEDKNQEESRRKVIKAKKDTGLPSQESQIVPSVHEEVCSV